ncbi:hypothetical protein MA16_Dca006694 [Dendrobium catenatum]|uniref:Uncharacterized protein n=1 Tax=Dendrobium catenatum TaxID=906689 RepID=A0A2I0W8Y1_9ASPA|nr:hypothetical protein MA16_Dca006694 [Dendrobium catenatum]
MKAPSSLSRTTLGIFFPVPLGSVGKAPNTIRGRRRATSAFPGRWCVFPSLAVQMRYPEGPKMRQEEESTVACGSFHFPGDFSHSIVPDLERLL